MNDTTITQETIDGNKVLVVTESPQAQLEPLLKEKYIPTGYYQNGPRRGWRKTYQLEEVITTPLKALATPSCYKCLGTGINGWKAGGLKAVICTCIPRTIPVPANG